MGITLAAFSGSLRKESFNTKLIKAFQKMAPESVKVEIVDIGDLPLVNQDLEENLPQTVKHLQSAVEKADAILLCTPEYNRSYSPVIKNALDWGARPEGNNKWKGKPVAVVGCTPYALGAFGAIHHLRQVAVYLDMQPLQQPEFYMGMAAEKFNEDGELTDHDTQKKINVLWSTFVHLINKLK